MGRVVLAAVFTALMVTPALTQDAGEVDLRSAANLALQAGDYRTASALSEVLLSIDPSDTNALFVRAVAARATGRIDTWADAAAAAYRTADTDSQRFNAAMLAGEAAARQERFTAAQIWLRRADQHAPPQAEQAVAQAYRQVSARNPLAIQLSFGVTPSNNVNNGGETTTIEIAGLPFELGEGAQQLGGYEATLGASIAYRLSADEVQRTDGLVNLFGKKVWLNSAAKEAAPAASGSDFDYGAIALGLRHSRLIWPDLGPSQVTAILGQSWSGGTKQANWIGFQLLQFAPQSDTTELRFGTTIRDERRNGAPTNDSQAVELTADWARTNEDGKSLLLGGSVKSTWSDAATLDSLAFGLSVSQNFPRWDAIKPSVTAEIETRDYRKWTTTPGGRRDDSLNIRLDVVLPDVSYFGFSPMASITARRVWSNVDIYDRKSISLGLTAVSRF